MGPSEEESLVVEGAPVYAKAPRALIRDPDLSAQAVRLWILLEDYASPSRPKPWPSMATLADWLGVSDRSVRSYRSELEAGGWLRVEARSGLSNLFVLVWKQASTPEASFRGGRKCASGGGGNQLPPKKNQEEEPLKNHPLPSQRETKEGAVDKVVRDDLEDSSNQEQPTPDTIAAEAFEQLGYPDTTKATKGEQRTIQRALDRGWHPDHLTDFGASTAFANPANPRRYLRTCWQNAANTDPPTTKHGHHRPMTPEQVEADWQRIVAERTAKGLPV